MAVSDLKPKTKSSTAPGATQRRTPRRTYRRPIGVMVRGHYQVLAGRSLSEGGALVSLGDGQPTTKTPKPLTAAELVVGTKVTVSLILPAGTTLILRGHVLYHEGDAKSGIGIGIKFDDVPLHQRREIRNYVSSKQAGEAELE